MVWVALDRIATVLLDANSRSESYKRLLALLNTWNSFRTFTKENRHGEWHILAPLISSLSVYEIIQSRPEPHIQGIRSDNEKKCTLRISFQGVNEIRVWYDPGNCIGGEGLPFIDDNRTVVQDIVPNVFDRLNEIFRKL